MDQKTAILCFLIGVVHYVKSWKWIKQNNNMTIRYKEKRSLTGENCQWDGYLIKNLYWTWMQFTTCLIGVAIAKYHKLGYIKQKMLITHSSMAWEAQWSRFWQIKCLMKKAAFLLYRQLLPAIIISSHGRRREIWSTSHEAPNPMKGLFSQVIIQT